MIQPDLVKRAEWMCLYVFRPKEGEGWKGHAFVREGCLGVQDPVRSCILQTLRP